MKQVHIALLAIFISASVGTDANPWYYDDYNEITNGLSSIDFSPWKMSDVIPFGENAFAIALNGWENMHCSASKYGQGRVLAIGRNIYVSSEYHEATDSAKTFTLNAINWLGKQKSGMVVANGNPKSEFVAAADNFEYLGYVAPADLATTMPDVYGVNAEEDISDEDVQLILNYVNNGGGLLVAGEAYHWWRSYNNVPGIEFANGFPGNKLLVPLGLLIGDSSYAKVTDLTKMPPPEANIFYTLRYLLDNNPNELSDLVEEVVEEILFYCFNSATKDMQEFDALYNEAKTMYDNVATLDLSLSENRDKHNRVIKAVLPGLLQKKYPILPAGNVATFPYEVPTSERITKTVEINGDYTKSPYQKLRTTKGIHQVFTGLYAAAGETITITVDESALTQHKKPSIQIGMHKNTLYGISKERSPDIIFHYNIHEAETTVAHPWGGCIYILLPHGVDLGFFNVTVSKTVLAPRFILGTTTLEEWRNEIRHYPAPWGELEIPDQVIFTVPSSELRDYDDPEEFLNEYKKIMHIYNYLNGLDDDNMRYRAERIVFDAQLPDGFMRSGYPIKGKVSYVPEVLDINRLRAGKEYAVFHEIGHNHQLADYTINAWSEGGAHIYAYRVNQEMYNGTISKMEPIIIDNIVYEWILRGKPKEEWGEMLVMVSLCRLFDYFGWESFRNLNKVYHDVMVNREPVIRTEFEKTDYFVRFYSQVVERNVCTYFQWWQQTFSDETLRICAGFPEMEVDLNEQRYGGHEEKATDANCDEGWIPFEGDCYFISNSEKNWHDAESACNEVAEDSHLASCLSTTQARFLGDTLKDSRDKIFVGIDEMYPDQEPRFFDGTLTSEKSILPWHDGEPDKDTKKECACFQYGKLKDTHCYKYRKFICKRGPTSCAQLVNKCEEGWYNRGNKCYRFEPTAVGTFEEAVTGCQNLGASLVEIVTESEFLFISGTLSRFKYREGVYKYRNYWLGMNDTSSGKWMNGENVVYSKWCSEMPSGMENQHGILKYRYYCWDEDDDSESQNGYICQKYATHDVTI